MKKMFAILLAFLILQIPVTVYAEDVESEEDQEEIEIDVETVEIHIPSSYRTVPARHGKVEEITVEVEIENEDGETETEERSIYVYLPFNYSVRQQYDIVYHQCGMNSVGNEIMDNSSFKAMLDNMIGNGDIKPCIFVIVSDALYGDTMAFKRHQLEIMQLVESEYSTYAGFDISEASLAASSAHRAVCGFSQGAYATWDILADSMSKYADWYIPISPFYYNGWQHANLISRTNGDLKVFNSIGSRETDPEYPFDGIRQLQEIKNEMLDKGFQDGKNARFIIIDDVAHSQKNAAEAYYYYLPMLF